MKKILSILQALSLIAILASSCSTTNVGASSRLYSQNVKDSFELYIDLPDGYKPDTGYSIVFYMDANLKMGTEIRRQIKLQENRTKLLKVIFIGVGHIGNYRTLRRRDFIPPVMENGAVKPSADPQYGQGENFFRFLRDELIPHVNETFPNNGRYTYIGHSFSGLFAFYCLMKPTSPFSNYVAISPSLWVNSNNIFEYERQHFESNKDLQSLLYHSCGTGEWANKVRASSREMKKVLDSRNYSGLHYIYTEHPGKNHNGTVPVSIEYVFQHLHL